MERRSVGITTASNMLFSTVFFAAPQWPDIPGSVWGCHQPACVCGMFLAAQRGTGSLNHWSASRLVSFRVGFLSPSCPLACFRGVKTIPAYGTRHETRGQKTGAVTNPELFPLQWSSGSNCNNFW